jgi:Retinal Maintenance
MPPQYNTIQYNTGHCCKLHFFKLHYTVLNCTVPYFEYMLCFFLLLLSCSVHCVLVLLIPNSYFRSWSLPCPQVHIFVGSAWRAGPSVDYMFFRNNTPNEAKLSAQLERSTAQCAYCCQCSWTQTAAERTLSQGVSGDPQWVCAGH